MSSAEFQPALLNSEELQLTTVGRRSGRDSSRPVWFVLDGERMYLLPGDGTDSQWYKNLLQTPTIRLSARGTTQSATTTPITEASAVSAVVAAFEEKYGRRQIEALYPHREVAVEAQALE
jgi:deazaflavin-dependent oxidoreductase (nitroreductase family)